MPETQVIIEPDGHIRFIYSDSLRGLMEEGSAVISRASHVEPDPDCPSQWMVDLGPSGGPVQKGFLLREDALRWEVDWLLANELGRLKRCLDNLQQEG